MKTIRWVCTKSDAWDWRGADDKAVTGLPNEITGTINLTPDAEFWYLCGYLILDKTRGAAGIRYYQENGQDLVQVFTDARGAWHDQPANGNPVASQTGATGKSGGISLTAAFSD